MKLKTPQMGVSYDNTGSSSPSPGLLWLLQELQVSVCGAILSPGNLDLKNFHYTQSSGTDINTFNSLLQVFNPLHSMFTEAANL